MRGRPWKHLTPADDRALSIAQLRATFAWFGLPLNDLTDDQIEEGALNTARLFASCGVKAADASRAMQQLARAT